MTMKNRIVPIVLVVLVLFLSACRSNIARNADGAVTVETTVNQQELQDAVNASMADPLITELNVLLQQGYILVTGQRQRLNDASKSDSLSFRLDLGVSNGQLTATISNALLDDKPIEQKRIDHWNETIANRLGNINRKSRNSQLNSVNVTPEAVTMNWLVSK
jgi:hypothetical protein